MPCCICKLLPYCDAAGSGYFELNVAALRTLSPDSALHEQAVLAGAAIPAPLLLPTSGGGTVIECCVVVPTGFVEIASLAPLASSARAVHVTATAASMANSLSSAAGASTKEGTAAGGSSVMLAAIVKPAGGTSKAAAVATLLIDTGRSGLCMDPAPFDCFLQLGQVFKAPGSTEVYVPAGLAALRVSPAAADLESAAPGSTAWAATVPVLAPKGSVSSDSRLGSSGSNERQLCVISALTAKSMGKAQASAGPAATAGGKLATAGRTECLYEVAWRVTEPVALATAGGDSSGGTLWRLAATDKGDPAAAAASAIASVQRMLKSGVPAAVQLQTVGGALLPASAAAGDSATGRTTAAAALVGLVKTLNQEVPQTSWSARNADSQLPEGHRAGYAALVRLEGSIAELTDAFGAADRSGACLAPLLLKSAALEQLGPYHLFPVPRGSLNSLIPLPVEAGRKLAPGEVLVAVQAVGINFRCAN